jgi:hypothetical protein
VWCAGVTPVTCVLAETSVSDPLRLGLIEINNA